VIRALPCLLALVLAAAPAHADDEKITTQSFRFVERGDTLTISFEDGQPGLSRLFDIAAFDTLDDGPQVTVVIRVWIYPQGSTEPVAFVLVQRAVVYEPWDEIFYISLDEPAGRRKLKEKRKAEVLKRLTAIEDLPVARLAALPPLQPFQLAMHVELNPISKETLAEVHRWLSQSTGGLDRGGAFFGSFVSVFVNPKIAQADRVLRIVSAKPFFRPKR
jgi:hypothetical protein